MRHYSIALVISIVTSAAALAETYSPNPKQYDYGYPPVYQALPLSAYPAGSKPADIAANEAVRKSIAGTRGVVPCYLIDTHTGKCQREVSLDGASGGSGASGGAGGAGGGGGSSGK